MIQFFFITLGLVAAVFIAWFAVWLPLKIEKEGEIIKTPGSLIFEQDARKMVPPHPNRR